MSFPYLRTGSLPSEGIYLDQLRRLISIVGVQGMQIALCKTDDGFFLNVFPGQRSEKSFYLKAEKSKDRRIFKNPQSAFRVCKQLGYSRVIVEL